jgi:sucrose synthase
MHDLLFTQEGSRILGHFSEPEKTPILAISPLASSRNFAGLVECFGKNKDLRARCNLILITNTLETSQANLPEEAEAITQIHRIIQQYNLQSNIRWIGLCLPGSELAEVYRIVADYHGMFVHFAYFSAFDRTILEAMYSGLPTFVSEFGGSLEILGENRGQFQVNPTDLERTAQQILEYLDQCESDSSYWQETSDWAIQQVSNHYTWRLHTQHLLLLAKMYSFWNFVFHDNRQALHRYLDTLFHLVYKPRAESVLKQN